MLFKLAYLSTYFIFLLKYNKLNYVIASLGLIFIMSLSMLSSIDSASQITRNVSSLAKLLYFPITFFFFRSFFSRNNYNEAFIYRIFNFLFWALFIVILASIFGIGSSQYGETEDGVSIGFRVIFLPVTN